MVNYFVRRHRLEFHVIKVVEKFKQKGKLKENVSHQENSISKKIKRDIKYFYNSQ